MLCWDPMVGSDVEKVAALGDPQRARLYAFVRGSYCPVTREEAATATAISRKLAAFHLDRLVDAGLLEASFERPTGVAGRIGRAPKRYLAPDVELSVTIPERHYDVVAEILLDAIAGAEPDEAPIEAVARVAREQGLRLGTDLRQQRRLGRVGPERGLAVLAEVLVDHGFEPTGSSDGLIERNCPFRRLAQRHPEMVCRINRNFVDGVIVGLGATRLEALLEPAEDRCCVVIRTR